MTSKASGVAFIIAAALASLAGLQFAASATKAELGFSEKLSPRPDGSRIDWRLKGADGDQKVPLVLIAQGSGCQSVSQSPGVAAVAAAFDHDAAILEVEQTGVEPGANPDLDHGGTCSGEFYAKANPEQRVADYRQVLSELKDAPWWNGKLILIGGSEGGLTVAMLSASIDADIVVMISSISNQTFGDIVLDAIGPEGRSQAEAAFARARQNPDASVDFAGISNSYWAATIDRVPLSYLTSAYTAYLIIQGTENDQPRSAHARAAVDAFARSGRCNLTYWELAGLDHGLDDKAGKSHLNAVSRQIRAWVNAVLADDGLRKC